MANTGPDGINRCGAFRGKKCEQQRYNEEMKNKVIQTEYTESNTQSNNTITYAVIGLVLLLVVAIIYKKFF